MKSCISNASYALRAFYRKDFRQRWMSRTDDNDESRPINNHAKTEVSNIWKRWEKIKMKRNFSSHWKNGKWRRSGAYSYWHVVIFAFPSFHFILILRTLFFQFLNSYYHTYNYWLDLNKICIKYASVERNLSITWKFKWKKWHNSVTL